MSSTAKGAAFENRVFSVFKRLLDDGDLFVSRENTKLYQKKGYYSKDRDDDIIVDVSIESFLPGADQYSILTVVECKDYSASVPVDDMEEFKAKLDQIAGKNVKGVFATTNILQRSALEYARTNGIAVVRFADDDEIQWILNRTSFSKLTYVHQREMERTVENALVSEPRLFSYFQTFISCGKKYLSSLEELLAILTESGSRGRTRGRRSRKDVELVHYLSDAAIADKAAKVVGQCSPEVLERPAAIPTQSLLEFAHRALGYVIEFHADLGADRFGRPVMAAVHATNRKMLLHELLSNDSGRSRFAICHELGHIVLGHTSVLEVDKTSDDDVPANLNPFYVDPAIARMEYQANWFAANVLMPTKTFMAVFVENLKLSGASPKHYGMMFVDEQPVNMRSYVTVTTALMKRFLVSRQAASIRLQQLGVLNDSRKLL